MDADADVVAPASLEVGDVVDGFRLDAVAHRGGMATLWHVSRVDPVAGDPPFLMKVPRVRGGEDPAAIVGFEVEQMIMPALAGAHVPRFVAKGDFTRVPYIVMEQIDGASLRERFDAAPLAIDEVARIGAKVATALHDLHRQHVVHLDVKPSNIVLRRRDDGGEGGEGDAVLIDFGLSHHDLLPDLLEEEFDLPMGTSPYMSPEQVRFVRNDPRSDLFSTGVMLYELTTGARPFGMPSSVTGLRRRLYRDPVAPRTIRPDCPPWLQEIVLRCLEVRPDRRYQTASQLAFDLLHSDQVALTSRATRTGSGSTVRTMKRWLASLAEREALPGGVAGAAARSPIVLVAVDVAAAEPALLDSVREAALRLLKSEAGARLACLTVMRIHRIGMDDLLEPDGTSRHVKLLVELRHWARPLLHAFGGGTRADDAASRITYHVLEAPDPASAVVEYARRNQVDHIVLGARSSGRLRRHLGSVSARVAAEADCTVTVVRANDGER